MNTQHTLCCALYQMSIHDYDDIKDIRKAIRDHKKYGCRCIFVISKKDEETLVENLIKLKFIQIHQFKRKQGYPQHTFLTMWVKNL